MWWVGCLVLVFGFMGAMVVEAHKAACSRPAWSQKKMLPDGGSRNFTSNQSTHIMIT